MQRVYELMLVLRPDFGLPAGEAGVEEKPVRDLVQKLVGDREVKELSLLGKKRLAYPIKKQTEGMYTMAKIAGAPVRVSDFENQMKMGTDILRFLLIAKG